MGGGGHVHIGDSTAPRIAKFSISMYYTYLLLLVLSTFICMS